MRTYTTSQGTTAKLKDDSVNVEDMDQEVLDAIIDAAGPLYADTPQDLVITSAADGTHSRGSHHYEESTPTGEGAWAADLRVWNLSDHEATARKLQEKLGEDYDVIAEWREYEGETVPSHIHVEYDPS